MRITTTDVARWTPVVRIRGRSMQPTLAPGQMLLTRPPDAGVAVGDVVALTTANGALYVKRVAAGPGDVVALEAGRLYVNDRPWNGQARVLGAHAQTWQVPDGHYFVVGDNLRKSDDSRVWAEPFVPASRISGVALRLWPWRRHALSQPLVQIAA
jgi:signal peptidase I